MINELKNYYEKYDGYIEFGDWLLKKSQWCIIIEDLIQNNHELRALDILKKMKQKSRSSEERDIINFMKKKIESKNYFEYNSIENINDEISKIYEVKKELEYFNRFKFNQNSFDNMISILKIKDRLKSKNIFIRINIKFDENLNPVDYSNILESEIIERMKCINYLF